MVLRHHPYPCLCLLSCRLSLLTGCRGILSVIPAAPGCGWELEGSGRSGCSCPRLAWAEASSCHSGRMAVLVTHPARAEPPRGAYGVFLFQIRDSFFHWISLVHILNTFKSYLYVFYTIVTGLTLFPQCKMKTPPLPLVAASSYG